jgi:DNA-binding beta-propeller fold protein YncE
MDRRTLYVGVGGGLVDAVDLATRTVVGSWSAAGTDALHLAVHPTLPRLYVSGNSDRMVELDATSGAVRRTFSFQGGNGQAVAVEPSGSRAYVAIEGGGSIEVWDLATGARAQRFGLPDCGPWGLAITYDGSDLYASCSAQSKILAIDAASGAVLRSYNAGEPRRIRFNADGSLVAIGAGSGVVVIR